MGPFGMPTYVSIRQDCLTKEREMLPIRNSDAGGPGNSA